MTRAHRQPQGVALLFLDIDDFKDVNDTLGHQAGDLVLRTVAERIGAVVRASDTVARLGGDEFAVLVEDPQGAEPPTELAERILAEVRRPMLVGEIELVLGASVGAVLSGPETEDADALVRDADIAMYAAKELGDRVTAFQPSMQARITERIQLVADLRGAIERGELDVVYQPIIELATDRMVGVEALVRWQHPQRGQLLPGTFIGAAEESGLIVELGDYVLGEACRAAQTWSPEGSEHLLVSVNLSPRQFGDEGLLDSVAAILDETGLAPGSLVLEITENVLIGDLPSAHAKLRSLRDMGARIAIDDFGMGYSSLNYLRALPVDILKIDRAFVSGLGTEDGADGLVAAIVQMARAMDLETIAEAVEMPHEAERLRELGSHNAQGFHFARPMSATDITRVWLEGGTTSDLAALADTAVPLLRS
jgi:diguanylate cyclase (GGDEF)-like protein